MAKKSKTPLSVEAIKYKDATRKNIPTTEYRSVMQKKEAPVKITYPRDGNALPEEKEQGRDRHERQ